MKLYETGAGNRVVQNRLYKSTSKSPTWFRLTQRCILDLLYPPDTVTHAIVDSPNVGMAISSDSVRMSLPVCPRCKRKTAQAINAKVCTHYTYTV